MISVERVELRRLADTDNKIFEFCFDIALHDATMQSAYNDTLESLNPVKSVIKDIIEKYIKEIFSNEYSKVDTLTTINDIECSDKLKCFNKSRDDEKKFKFGNIQKIVNMTAKYMYITTYNNEKMRRHFEKCHCPIDRFICKKIFDLCNKYSINYNGLDCIRDITVEGKRINKSFFYYMTFSKISKQDYLYLQELIQLLCKNENTCPLEFDFRHWKE